MVSVIIATYRRDYTLKRAIESVLNQTYKDIEIIVVDDNAEHIWNEKVKGIVCKFDNIKYICNMKNEGCANSRNIGINNANGKYISFLDDDDLYLPDKIERQLNDIIKSKADFSVTDLYLYNNKDKIVDKRIRNYIKFYDINSLLNYHLMYHITGTDTLMFKKDYLEKIGGFPPVNIGDEFYLMNKAIKAGGKMSYLPGCSVKAYIHTGCEKSVSSGMSKIRGENVLFEYKKKQFSTINKKSQRYIIARHHAVLAFAYLRMKNCIMFFVETVKAFFASPISCVKIFIGAKR